MIFLRFYIFLEWKKWKTESECFSCERIAKVNSQGKSHSRYLLRFFNHFFVLSILSWNFLNFHFFFHSNLLEKIKKCRIQLFSIFDGISKCLQWNCSVSFLVNFFWLWSLISLKKIFLITKIRKFTKLHNFSCFFPFFSLIFSPRSLSFSLLFISSVNEIIQTAVDEGEMLEAGGSGMRIKKNFITIKKSRNLVISLVEKHEKKFETKILLQRPVWGDFYSHFRWTLTNLCCTKIRRWRIFYNFSWLK